MDLGETILDSACDDYEFLYYFLRLVFNCCTLSVCETASTKRHYGLFALHKSSIIQLSDLGVEGFFDWILQETALYDHKEMIEYVYVGTIMSLAAFTKLIWWAFLFPDTHSVRIFILDFSGTVTEFK
ncbi:hypothetical protein MKW98_020213 [Papaver atlanticum]|uniref:Uncharacterized protein n=1 Tax=Papaver atlanticum TaxID=357466 RepID=A0AAD4SAB1_9MAGN|nr:hypothetical protein MKW98_020213 [Papaver atlanticum]